MSVQDVEDLKNICHLFSHELFHIGIFNKKNKSLQLYELENDYESKEIEILNNYLAKMMDENEIKNIVKTVIDDIGATSMADMGKIMPEVMKRGNGLIDGKSAQKFVNEIIG